MEDDMVASGEEQQMKMFVVFAGQDGFYLAMVPAVLSPERTEEALRELGVDGEASLEVGGWRTTADDVAVARIPFPGAV